MTFPPSTLVTPRARRFSQRLHKRSILHRFSVRRQLGGGSFGTVYEAFDREHGRTVALKHLDGASQETIARIRREFGLLSSIRHPNLAALHELMRLEGEHLITMELVAGENVLAHLGVDIESVATTCTADDSVETENGVGRADPGRAARVLLQLAHGVRELHAAARLHRDIKPSNVIVERRTERAVLLDFDLVLRLSDAGTPRRDVEGTPQYMAPEQALRGPLTPAADWYAFGVVLYEALTARRPFVGGMSAVLVAKSTTEPPAPSVLTDVPPALDDLCVRLLRRAPEARPSGDEVIETLSASQHLSREVPWIRPCPRRCAM